MPRLPEITRNNIISLRKQGYTYSEIREKLQLSISNGTISYVCKNTELTEEQQKRIKELQRKNLAKSRIKAVEANKKAQTIKLAALRTKNLHLTNSIQNHDTRLVALAMLYLGEGAKWKSRRGPLLANSNPNIIKLYMSLLQKCYQVMPEHCHARVQHRADQNSDELIEFWSNVTDIPRAQFYACYVDKRSIGKQTKNKDYMGVCSVMCPGTYIQLELQEIADIIFEAT